ncbi:uncharacterized protein TRIADDRAFT_20799 [Trichoplax adhaerens]|uniref:RRM domain-containing protein n=1 Tax=Trichoplax adhaerens TaxID=10228 RepID=B3RQ79_TRIAD|nr:hypothetical protein TRIADDRAFT_20799 [Trichoplax adhaerens]EDV27775.1 hypothetical protein TRIADDRAFT_20799 [Trichoplax adhaerens]|eukprot:XP_002109609.1 hypothetical protein TRIADDRAFT_20799 [Trichoplax adhaerens]
MKIFIGGLSFDTTDETLRNYFAKYGDIADSVVICESGSRKPRGFGFVTYKDVTSVKNCLAGIPHQIDGKTVEVKHAVPRESNELAAPHERRSKKIFIGGLGASTTETEIRQYFNQFGKILNIDLKKDRDTNVLRGFGFVVFEAEDSVDKVLTAR